MTSDYDESCSRFFHATTTILQHVELFGRDRFVLPAEMPYLLRSIDEEPSQTAKDILWTLLLVGARKTNTLQMRWEQINWEHKTWRVPESKNGEVLPLPLVDRAIEILKRRKENSNSVWGFPSEKNPIGHFVNIKRAWKRVLQLPVGLMDTRLHDIRRTFGSYQAINGASLTVIGKSLGHKSHHSTQIYARLNLDPVRASVERATETMFNSASMQSIQSAS